MKQIALITLLLCAVLLGVNAQNAPTFPKGEKSPNVHHVGDVWLNEVSAADSTFTYNVTQAVFAAGARLDWHKHPGGQVLLITEGKGYYQERGKLRQVVRRGEVVKCQPDVEHWHGAAPDSGVTYLATTPVQKGRTVWAERVPDEQYYGAKMLMTGDTSAAAKDLMSLSRDKWRWMSERKVDTLAALFRDEAVFVHMGATMGKTQELEVIKGGFIQYKSAEIQEVSVQLAGSTAIVLNKIRLVAVVGGNEVINPFVVTEVYVQEGGAWTLASMSFTKLLMP